MTFIRSLLFMLFMVITMPLAVMALLLVFWLPMRSRRLFVMPWIRLVMWMVRHLLRIEQRVLGAENIPATP
ncbi:MAG: 1-acyl-sn-glycerol-3-phosphate acyltransferase, partial [Hydrogenophaga sp.]|nr:1-acyl-sn-glycerol-3-phosphate acyltransferase [Hydrogenophaga sp.]